MSVINKDQGAVKQSEIATDEALSTIQTAENEDGLTVVKQLQAMVADSINKNSYILMSEGRIQWDGTKIIFDEGGNLTDITIKILQNQIGADSFSVDLNLVAALADSTNEFNSIELLDNEVLYIEIDRPELLASGGSINLENAVGGLSNTPHFTVRKEIYAPGTGVPKITTNLDGDVTPSLYIPLAYARTYTIGATTFNDIWWIPHGIRWPKNTTSTLGAVIVEGVETYPNRFVDNLLDFQTAASELSAIGGGVILLTDSFSIDSNITISENVTLLSRGEIELSFVNGGTITCEDGSTIKDFKITSVAGFNNAAVKINGNRVVASNIKFDLTDSVNDPLTKAVEVSGDFDRIERCRFDGFVDVEEQLNEDNPPVGTIQGVITTDQTLIAQDFTTVGGFDLGRFDINYLSNSGSASGDLFLDIYTESSGTPSVLQGTSDAVSTSSLTSGINPASKFIFSTPIVLSSATKYFFVIRFVGAIVGGVSYIYPNTDLYAGHAGLFSTNLGSSWSPLGSGRDIRFIAYNAASERAGIDYLATADNSYDIDSEWL